MFPFLQSPVLHLGKKVFFKVQLCSNTALHYCHLLTVGQDGHIRERAGRERENTRTRTGCVFLKLKLRDIPGLTCHLENSSESFCYMGLGHTNEFYLFKGQKRHLFLSLEQPKSVMKLKGSESGETDQTGLIR